MNPFDLARRIERAEMAVWSDAVRAAPDDVLAQTGLSVEPVADGISIMASRVPNLLYNRAFGFGLDAPVTERDLDNAIARFRRDQPFTIQPSPMARPPQIHDWLAARGLESHFNWVIWARGDEAAAPAPTDLRITTIGQDLAAIWADLAETIFAEGRALTPWLRSFVGRVNWRHYFAWDGDTPVGIAVLYVDGEVGWLGWGGTLASHRKRGGQSALIARRIEDARAAGCRWLTVETAEDVPERPNPSYRNCARARFRVLHRRPSYAYFPEGFRKAN